MGIGNCWCKEYYLFGRTIFLISKNESPLPFVNFFGLISGTSARDNSGPNLGG